MKCPACKTNQVFHEAELESGLIAKRCEQCGGNWVAGALYWRWVEQHGSNRRELPATAQTTAAGASLQVHDSGAAKLCPECGRFLTHLKVGHGLDFYVDRCANCSGLWFDANEWEILKGRDLHDDVHRIFSDVWQADVARQERHKAHEQVLLEKLGAADLAEIKRIKAWLDGHRNRSQLYAFLLDREE